MLGTISPELVGILTLILIVVGFLAVVVYQRVIEPRVAQSDFYKRYKLVLDVLDDVVSDAVLRIAFAPGDLSEFEEEAEETGRDVRLVAAMYLINRFTDSHGVDLDEEQIVSSIEAKLAMYKDAGLIPRGSPEPDEQPQ